MKIFKEIQFEIAAVINAGHRNKARKQASRQMKSVFKFIGIAAMAAALYMSIDIRTSLREAAGAEGSVVAPKPSPFSRGAKAVVDYPAENPGGTSIIGFISIWGAPLILGSVGGMFYLVGAAFGFFAKLKEQRAQHLRQHGTPFKTEFQRVVQHKSMKINHTWPYQVFTQWKHPLTAETRVFRSYYLLFDPTPYLKTKDIMVFVDKDDPEKYLVDLSFIPELES